MCILFIHLNTDTFMSLTCTYTLAFWAYKERVYNPLSSLSKVFVTPEPLQVLRSNFGPLNKVFLGTAWGQNHTPL